MGYQYNPTNNSLLSETEELRERVDMLELTQQTILKRLELQEGAIVMLLTNVSGLAEIVGVGDEE